MDDSMVSEVDAEPFSSLATLQFSYQSRLLPSACCPDKDLVILIQRLGVKDRLSLWKMQGSKKWEVSVEQEADGTPEEIVAIAWSPDGQTIAVAHNPPRVTLHSIQDGHEERSLSIRRIANHMPIHLTGIWWWQQNKEPPSDNIPEIFNHNGAIPGSALSTLNMLPLLDPLKDETQSVGATELFAFQSTKAKPTQRSKLPSDIASWPTLPPDPISASIQPSDTPGSKDRHTGDELDKADDANFDSILAVADDVGCLHPYLEGCFPFGSIEAPKHAHKHGIASVFKHGREPVMRIQYSMQTDDGSCAALAPISCYFPLISQRIFRDEAKISSVGRELVWYLVRSLREMRSAWYGSDTIQGAREFGIRWERILREKQKTQFGQKEPDAILDLTALLVTGKASEALSDLLGSGGENMGDRGIMKWEATVSEALIKLRDYAERRVGPAFQRVHIVLEEVRGWAELPAYEHFWLVKQEVEDCLAMAGQGIVLSAWLASEARQELRRFREFMSWIKYELTRVNASGDAQATQPGARHDILMVNDYLVSGLINSPIDKWFEGAKPSFNAEALGTAPPLSLHEAITRAREALASRPLPPVKKEPRDISHAERNVDALVECLASSCQRMFDRAASAAGRSAELLNLAEVRPSPDCTGKFAVRERTMEDPQQAGVLVQNLAIWAEAGGEESPHLCLARVRYSARNGVSIGVALLECSISDGGGGGKAYFDVLGADFFDEDNIVIVFNVRGDEGAARIALANYNEVAYQDIPPGSRDGHDTLREGLFLSAVRRWGEGEIHVGPVPIKRARRLGEGMRGGISLAVNGRKGRRVGCVLDERGLGLEVLDLEWEEAEEEDAEGSAPGG